MGDRWTFLAQWTLAGLCRRNHGPIGGIHSAPYPNPSFAAPIRIAAGRAPVWLPNGDELLYINGGKLFQVSVHNGSATGKPRLLLSNGVSSFDLWTRQFDVAPDGRILSILRPEAKPVQAVVEVVRNAGEEYRRLRR